MSTMTDVREQIEANKVERTFTLGEARAAVENYYSGDMKRHIIFDTLRHDYDDRWVCELATFEAVSGMKLLGEGMYAKVYALGPNKVLKIIQNSDDGYARFAEKCKEMKGNPYLPRILWTGVWGGKRVYILERLSMEAPEGIDTYDTKDYFAQALRSRSSRNPFLVPNKELLAVITLLQQSGWTSDLHHGNIMFRGATPVVTDPAC